MKYALLVIDVQNGVMDKALEQSPLCDTILLLAKACRESGVEVIFVRHDDGEGSKLTKGTDAFEIYAPLAPAPGERVFDKRVNSALRDCGLREYLRERGVDGLIVTGLQTEYCIDATIKAAFEHGFTVVVPKDGFGTKDNAGFTAAQLNAFFADTIWNGRYAGVLPVGETLARIRKG